MLLTEALHLHTTEARHLVEVATTGGDWIGTIRKEMEEVIPDHLRPNLRGVGTVLTPTLDPRHAHHLGAVVCLLGAPHAGEEEAPATARIVVIAGAAVPRGAVLEADHDTVGDDRRFYCFGNRSRCSMVIYSP